MKNRKILVKNPPSKWPKAKKIRACGAARGALIEIENERLLTSRKSAEMACGAY